MKRKSILAGFLAMSVALTGLPAPQLYAAGPADGLPENAVKQMDAAAGDDAAEPADGLSENAVKQMDEAAGDDAAVKLDAGDGEADPQALDAPVLNLKFEDSLTDTSGNNSAIKANKETVSYVDGISGKALSFDGSTQLDLGTNEALSPEKLTLSFWVNPHKAMSGEQVITWNKTVWYSDGWYLSSENDNTPLSLSVGPAANGQQPYMISIAANRDQFFPAGQWTHIVVTYDSSTKEAAIFRNGIPQSTYIKYGTSNTSTGVVGPCPDIQKTVGYNGPDYKGSFLNAALDEYRIYNETVDLEGAVALYEESGLTLDKEAIAQSDLDGLNIPATASRKLSLPGTGNSGSVITWASSHPDVIAADGTVTPPETGAVDVTLTATASFAKGKPVTAMFPVSVAAKSEQASDKITDSGIANVALADSYLTHAAQKENEYLLSLSSKKFLYEFYVVSGLTPPTTDRYQGWERSNGTNFRGHTFGHYMSALSQAYEGTQDAGTKEKLLAEIRDAVNGLKECQDAYAAKNPSSAGYVSAFRESILNKTDGTGSSDENVIVPWYNLHKVLAGLIDIYTFVKDADDGQLANKALGIAEAFSEYVYNRCSKLTDNTTMLRTEYGGMNEALYEIYDITGNDHYKAAAQYFDEVSLFNSLAAGRDVLSGKHANTTIPKLTGALKRYTVLTENQEYYDKLTETEKDSLEKYKDAAINFWDITIAHHTYVTGGNSQSEHFHDADQLYADATKGDYDGALTCETCNTYNMLKLSRELYKLTKDKKYMDYYENTYINAILSSQNPDTGTTMYFQPMAPGYNKVFNRPFDEFWCCTGTGMENFSKLGDTIYFTEQSDVYVNMYFSSTFHFEKQNLKLAQEANMPNEDEVNVQVTAIDGTEVAANTSLRFRIPDWTVGAPELYLNGAKQEIKEEKGYAVVSNVKAGDVIRLKFPMEVKAYSTQDNQNFVAFKYGPVVLSTALGTNNIEASSANGILVRVGTKDSSCQTAITVQDMTVEEWMANVKENLVRIEDSADGRVQFQLKNTDSPDLIYTPHFMRYQERYGLYMTFEVKDSKEAQANIKRKKERLRDTELTADSLDSFDENNSEAAKNMKASETSEVGSYNGRTFRHVPKDKEGWFSYDLQVDTSAEKNYLECTYATADAGRKFDIYINDEFLKTVTVTNAAGGNTFYAELDEIPEKYWKNPTKFKVDTTGNEVTDEQGNKIPVVTVKFQTNSESKSPVGGLYGIAIKTKGEYSTVAELSRLSFADGKLTPGFSASKKAYTLVVPEASAAITLNAVPNVPSGLVYVNGILVDDTLPREVPLAEKKTMVEVRAYAQDHTTAIEYRINVIKSDSPVSEEEINNANAINEVLAGINSIGVVRYTKECKAQLDAVQKAYDALTAEQKNQITNYSKLEAAIRQYNRIKPEKILDFSFDDAENGLQGEKAKAQVASGTLSLVDDAKEGKALSLSNGTYLAVTDSEGKALLTDYNALTISYWGKVDNANANWAFYAAPDATSPTYQKEVYLGILDSGNSITAERYHNTGSRPVSATTDDVARNEWRFVTVVCDSDSTALYINGELKSKEGSSYALADIFGENGIVYIGKATWGSGEFYNGLMDEMSIYNFALTPEDVKQLYEGKEIEIPKEPEILEGSISISCAGFTYDGSTKAAPKVESTTNTGAEVTYKYYADAACTQEVAQPSEAGTYYVKGFAAETDAYGAAVSEAVSFTISKAVPSYSLPTGLTAAYGDTLAKVTLPQGFAFESALQTKVGAVGNRSFKVAYTPADTKNYEAVAGISVTVKVLPKKVTSATITGIKTMYYTGKAITQPGLKVKGYQAGTDYTLSYTNNKNVGKATVTIQFKGNYTGSLKKTFQIKKQIPVKGKVYKSGSLKYRVTKSAASGGTVELSAPVKKTYASVTVPATVKLNGYTFKVTGIGANAFKGNKKLAKVTIGANVTKIGKNAFQSCAKLKKVTIKSKKLKSVGKNAFKGIYSKAVITVPKAQKKAYSKLLKGKGQKKTVKIK